MTKESQPKSQNASSFTNKSPLTYILTRPHPFWGQKGKVDWSVKDPGGLEEGEERGGDLTEIYTTPVEVSVEKKKKKKKKKKNK